MLSVRTAVSVWVCEMSAEVDTLYKASSIAGAEMSVKCEAVEPDTKTAEWMAYAALRKITSEPLALKREYVFVVRKAERCDRYEVYELTVYLPNFSHIRVHARVRQDYEKGIEVEYVTVSEVF